MSSEISSTSTSPSQSMSPSLTPSALQKALSCSVGPEAQFKSFKVDDFCAKGVNFTCYVTSVVVKYQLYNKEKSISYVAKWRQPTQIEFFDTSAAFEKEGKFYVELVPALNIVRQGLNLPALKFPSCFFTSLEAGQELLLLEDMRAKSFKMPNTETGLSKAQVLLVMKELAHLHASALLLEEKMGSENFSKTYNFFYDTFTSQKITPILKEALIGYVENAVRVAQKIEGYEDLVERLRQVSPKCFEEIDAALADCDPKFLVVNHGDCWKNNTLFRYEGSDAAEVCLVDLQVNRRASLAIDLNHFLFSSLDNDTKKNGLADFLSAYYNAFKEVFDAACKPMTFTTEELYQEYRRKNTYGVMICLMSFSTLGLKADETPDFTEINKENASESIDETQRKLIAAVNSNPELKGRLVGLLDEIFEHKIY